MTTKLRLALCFSLFFAAPGFIARVSAQNLENPAPVRTLIRAGHLLDAKTGKISDGQTIVVVGDTIQAISPAGSITPQAGDVMIDLSGLTVLPGLIDVHTHLTGSPDFDPYRELTST